MNIAIFSDEHIGRRMYRTDEVGFNRYEQAGYQALKEFVRIIKEEKPDLVIRAGDAFDVPNPTTLAITNYLESMDELREFPTMMILGNHEYLKANRENGVSSAALGRPTYFADYSIKTVELNNILFVLMPYIYDTAENIRKYLKECEEVAKASNLPKKILVTHGVTDSYFQKMHIDDPIKLSDELIELFDYVIIGHIHTPFTYRQGKCLVISPGAVIDYQANKDRTGPVFLNTDTGKYRKVLVKTPHMVKVTCTEADINETLRNVTNDIYVITYSGDPSAIDNDEFIRAKEKALRLTLDVVKDEEVAEETKVEAIQDVYSWVREHYPEYNDNFTRAKEELNGV